MYLNVTLPMYSLLLCLGPGIQATLKNVGMIVLLINLLKFHSVWDFLLLKNDILVCDQEYSDGILSSLNEKPFFFAVTSMFNTREYFWSTQFHLSDSPTDTIRMVTSPKPFQLSWKVRELVFCKYFLTNLVDNLSWVIFIWWSFIVLQIYNNFLPPQRKLTFFLKAGWSTHSKH